VTHRKAQHQYRYRCESHSPGNGGPHERLIAQSRQTCIAETTIVSPPQLRVLLLLKPVPSAVIRFQRLEFALAPLNFGDLSAQPPKRAQGHKVYREEEWQPDKRQSNV